MLFSGSVAEAPPYPGACKCKPIYCGYIYVSLNTPLIFSLLKCLSCSMYFLFQLYAIFNIDRNSLVQVQETSRSCLGYCDTIWDTDTWKQVILFAAGFHSVAMFSVVVASSWGERTGRRHCLLYWHEQQTVGEHIFLTCFVCPDRDFKGPRGGFSMFQSYKLCAIYRQLLHKAYH